MAAVALLSGALAPGVIFEALSRTMVNNVVLVGRIEPPLTLALSIWFLGERTNGWEIVGAIVSFVGVVVTVVLQGLWESPSAPVTVATSQDARCSRQYAPNVARTPRYPLNPAGIDRCTVATATARSDRADK